MSSNPELNYQLFCRIYHTSEINDMKQLILIHSLKYLDDICKQNGDKKSIIHYLCKQWWYELVEEACKNLPDSINHESRLNKTPLADCFYPNDNIIKKFQISKDETLEHGKKCIQILMKYGADITRTSFRHLSVPFEMGSICIDPVLQECLLPPKYEQIDSEYVRISHLIEISPPMYHENV